MNKTIVNISIALFTLATITVSCGRGSASATETVATEVLPEDIVELRGDQIKLAGIETGSVEMRSMGNIIKVSGYVSVAPQNQATVSMPLGGFIKSTSLFPGNSVSKGQTLAVIENQDFVDIQRDYLEAGNKLVYAEAEFKRHSDLYNEEVYSEKNLQQVTVEYKNLKADVKSLEQKLMLIGITPANLTEDNISSTVNLVSPINGFLKSVNVNIGKYVSPTDVLFEVVNSSQLFLELSVFEKDAGRISKGQKIRFFINNETEEHSAEILHIGKSVNGDKTLTVYGTVTSSCANILPGMYVNALIEESKDKVQVLPSEAVVSFDDKEYIFIFEKDKEEAGQPFTEYRMIEVKKGISGKEFTEVKLLNGLNLDNSKVVVKGAYNLLSAKKNAGEMAC
jgi:membrane fusion protein, heavy metal efflux system